MWRYLVGGVALDHLSHIRDEPLSPSLETSLHKTTAENAERSLVPTVLFRTLLSGVSVNRSLQPSMSA
jgi:hypothetical protein